MDLGASIGRTHHEIAIPSIFHFDAAGKPPPFASNTASNCSVLGRVFVIPVDMLPDHTAKK